MKHIVMTLLTVWLLWQLLPFIIVLLVALNP